MLLLICRRDQHFPVIFNFPFGFLFAQTAQLIYSSLGPYFSSLFVHAFSFLSHFFLSFPLSAAQTHHRVDGGSVIIPALQMGRWA